jgi:hypothetical protein
LKGGVGSGKDKCNYFAMRAWKNSPEFENNRLVDICTFWGQPRFYNIGFASNIANNY